jgi:catechol 2,3-dioxygenase-like lactoylglutathione lyase family enzyme
VSFFSRIIVASMLCVVTITVASGEATAEEGATRPPITGVARVQIYVTDVAKARDFYEKTLRLPTASSCSTELADCLVVNERQQIQLVAAPTPAPSNLIAKVAFATTDVAQMRRYLIAKGFAPNSISVDDKHIQHFSMEDPEGHIVSFVQQPASTAADKVPNQISAKLIHAGFIVRDRQVEDKFYKDVLGFHLYWQGGMKDDQTSWVSMQVPDGTEWIEYMLNIPSNSSRHTIGVMNHVALGVTDIKVAKEQLLKNGWKPGEEPKLGRDGKWQLNLYDPDDTRVEFMEFKPVEKPCCSEFMGTHPVP